MTVFPVKTEQPNRVLIRKASSSHEESYDKFTVMEPTTNGSGNSANGYNNTAARFNSELCHPFSNVYVDAMDNTLPYLVNAAFNMPLSVIATFANVLVFLAIHRTTSIFPPSKRLLSSLVLTDVGIGLVVQPQLAVHLISKATKNHSLACLSLRWYAFTGSTFSFISMFTMAGISLDRFIAVNSHLSYRSIVTTKRVTAYLAFAWSVAILYPSTRHWDIAISGYITPFGILICSLVMSVAYIKVYRRLRHLNISLHPEEQAHLSMAKYKKIVSTMLRIYVIFMICFLPVSITVLFATYHHSVLTQCIGEFCYTVMLLKSSINPFFYCFRLPGIRAEVKKQLRKIPCQVVYSEVVLKLGPRTPHQLDLKVACNKSEIFIIEDRSQCATSIDL